MSKNRYSQIIKTAREAFIRNVSKDVSFRKQQLKQLYKCLEDNEKLFVDALKQDFCKPRFETIVTEIDFIKNDIRSQLFSIDDYVKPKKVAKNMVAMMDDAFIHYEPYGVVLVIGAWNYPVQLSLGPLIGAISAGNCAVLKPSEISPNTADLLAKLLPQYLNKECYHVVTGGPAETAELLENKFDYIFFTGSTSIGRLVHQAAAKHMTPVTLELGGKSPCFIDESVPNFEMAARRILWGKLLNAGQTCVAPDYVLCSEKVQDKLTQYAEKIVKEFYGSDPKKSSDFPRIVNDKHFERLNKLLKSSSGKPKIGGDTDASERYIAPTLLTNVSPSDQIMKEEIFGPLLPIVTINNVQEAIDLINSGEKPLLMYLFTTKSDVINKFLNETSSGSVCANDAVIHLTVETLPFGGVGASGIGAYHGRASFETFSHGKSVLVRTYNPILESIGSARYPPYSDGKLAFMSNLLKNRKSPIPVPPGLSYLLTFGLGMGAIFAYQYADIQNLLNEIY